MLIDFFYLEIHQSFLFYAQSKIYYTGMIKNLKCRSTFFSSLTSVLYSYNAHFHHKVQTFAFSAEPEHRHTVWSLKGQNTQQAKGDYVDAVLDLKGLFPAGTGVLIFN